MAELNSSSLDSFIETVKNGAEEAASAFERTFDTKVEIRPGEGGSLHIDQLSGKISGKGLALLLMVGQQGITVLIPSSTGLVPPWCDEPDATGKSKLSTFAQEWGMNLVPEDFFPEDFKAAVLSDLSAGLLRARPGLDGGCLELALSKPDGGIATIFIVWPLEKPDQLLEEPKAAEAEPIIGPPTFGSEAPNFIGQGAPNFDPFAGQDFGSQGFGEFQQKRRSLDDLPGYTRSALKVKIPVAAVLARARKPIKSILELGVGSVIQFDKSVDELLEVEVGQSVVIGTAEAVKVGDKFGFRISTVLLPDERFRKVEVRREGEYRVNQDAPQIIGKAPIKSLDKNR